MFLKLHHFFKVFNSKTPAEIRTAIKTASYLKKYFMQLFVPFRLVKNQHQVSKNTTSETLF